MRMTLTCVIPPLEPVLPNSWVTLAFTGSESMVIIKLIFILFLGYYFKGEEEHNHRSQTIIFPLAWCGLGLQRWYIIVWEVIKLMRLSYYDQSPERVNPEFIGIANKYSEHKKKRLHLQSRKKELDSDVFYTTKLDQSLERTLESKLNELERLEQSRQRHLDEIKYKQELDERRRLELESLKQRNTQNRITTKMNIQDARNNLMMRNKINKEQLELDLSRLSQRLEDFVEKKQKLNHIKYNEIRQQKRQGKTRVNSFHRQRNKQSLNAYLSKIKKEKHLRKQHSKRINDHENKLKDLSKTVQFKKSYLYQLQTQIFKYRTDLKSVILGPYRRKYTESNKSQTRFLPGQFSQILKSKQLSELTT